MSEINYLVGKKNLKSSFLKILFWYLPIFVSAVEGDIVERLSESRKMPGSENAW